MFLDVVRFDAACFAQRAFCARLVFLRAVADIVRVASDVEPLYEPTNAMSPAFNADTAWNGFLNVGGSGLSKTRD
jgi:hypothetical protein